MIKRYGLHILAFVLGLNLAVANATDLESDDAKRVVRAAVSEVIIPRYQSFQSSAGMMSDIAVEFCDMPDAVKLDQLRDAYGYVVRDFSKIEMFRFGPARQDNRFERMYFWPDTNGRGAKQVNQIIENTTLDRLTTESLGLKSVAVQGLLALDILLSETHDKKLLTTEHKACGYLISLTGQMKNIATELNEEWSGSYGDMMINTGPDNTVYRSNSEALQEMLRSIREQLQILRDHKILAVMSQDTGQAKPKRAPFWRTDLTLENYKINTEALVDLLQNSNLSILLPATESGLIDELVFELNMASKVFENFQERKISFVNIPASQADFDKVIYTTYPLSGALSIMEQRLPAALGLALGFNSLDGD